MICGVASASELHVKKYDGTCIRSTNTNKSRITLGKRRVGLRYEASKMNKKGNRFEDYVLLGKDSG